MPKKTSILVLSIMLTSPLATSVIAEAEPPSKAAMHSDENMPNTEKSRAFETSFDGSPLIDTGRQFYKVDMSQFAASGRATQRPLPPFNPDGDEDFFNQCMKMATGAAPPKGYIVNHYRWCKPIKNHWQKYRLNSNGSIEVTDHIAFGTIITGYADPKSRKTRVFHDIISVEKIKGRFSDRSRIWNNADCWGTARQDFTCKQSVDPTQSPTIEEIIDRVDSSSHNHRFRTRTDMVDTSPRPSGSDRVSFFKLNDLFRAESAIDEENPSFARKSELPTTFRCDGRRFNSTGSNEACIFNDVNPFLTYDKNNPTLSEVAIHIQDAQTQGAPGKFGINKPESAPLTRTYDGKIIRRNREKARSICKANNNNQQWPSTVQCDEYPFATALEGSASGGPSSSRLVNSKHNGEAGGCLNFGTIGTGYLMVINSGFRS